MRIKSAFLLVVTASISAGCHTGVIAKRHSELNCPTDVRQMHNWPMGEDAIFWGPCGLSEGNYGFKATSWRNWPSDVNGWRMGSQVDAACDVNAQPEQMYVEPQPADGMPTLPPPN